MSILALVLLAVPGFYSLPAAENDLGMQVAAIPKRERRALGAGMNPISSIQVAACIDQLSLSRFLQMIVSLTFTSLLTLLLGQTQEQIDNMILSLELMESHTFLL